MNDLVRDLGLSKNAAEILASRSHEKFLLNKISNSSYVQNQEQVFMDFLKTRISLFTVITSWVFSRNFEFHCIIKITEDYS